MFRLDVIKYFCKSFLGEDTSVSEEAIQDQAIQYLQELKKYVINAEKYIYTNSKNTNSDDLSSIGSDYYPIFDKIQRAILHDIPITPENWKVINVQLPSDGNDDGYPICVEILTNIYNTFDFSSIPGMKDLVTQTIEDFEFFGQD